MMKNIAIFASGSGSNAENIVNYFRAKKSAEVKLILSNNKNAGVIERSNRLKIPCVIFDRKAFYETDQIEKLLLETEIDLVVLAGFLWLIPETLISLFPKKIINIHPALLPDHGGKGFYGSAVHQAVLDTASKKSGITVHYVNEKFDEGEIIFQATCDISEGETPVSLAEKIHQLEYTHFPKVIESVLNL